MKRKFTFYHQNDYIGVIDITLKYDNGNPKFSILGNCRGAYGQCINELDIVIQTYGQQDMKDFWNEIKYLRKTHGNNGLHAGTKKQELYLDKNKLKDIDYKTACDILDSVNLLIDDGYKYGTGWLTWQIPLEDLKKIEHLFTCKPPRFVTASRLYSY